MIGSADDEPAALCAVAPSEAVWLCRLPAGDRLSQQEQHRVKEIFLKAADRPAPERDALLDEECGGDEGLRREVETLLEHHDPKSIVGERAPSPEKRPSDKRVLGLRASSSATSRPFYRRRPLWAFVAAALLVGLGLWAKGGVEGVQLRNRGAELQVFLDANVATLNIWIEEQKFKVRHFADDPRIRPLVNELLEIAEGENASEDLMQAPAREALLELWRPLGSRFPNNGVGIASERGMAVFNPSASSTGVFLSPVAMLFHARVLAGETIFTRPLRYRDVVRPPADPDDGSMYTYFGAPIKNEKGRAIASFWLAFAAYEDFSDILETATIGSTGETYAFDDRGLMLSRSRFTEELRHLGLLPAIGDPDQAWDRGSQLNIVVRDPGEELEGADFETLDLETRPLTRLAAAAIASRTRTDPAEHRGVVVEPYRNYRGVEVVGSWQWLPELDFAVVTEMETSEALAPLHHLDAVFAVLFTLLTVFVGATLISSFSAMRFRRQMDDLRQLGEYSLVERIAQGGMGKVYRAEHAMLKRPAAVKVIGGEHVTEEAIVRFEREVQTTSRLRNPHVVEVYDFGRADDGTFYYAMEYLPGRNLTELVRAENALPPARVIHILKQACSALREAHAAGLVHRDIKPGNIMVCNLGGEDDFVKVLDFGLVKSVRANGTEDLTAATEVGGTLLYMPPERIKAPRELDVRSDIYSLGAVGYYLLTGRPLFDSDDGLPLIHRILTEVPPPVSERSSRAIPAALEGLLARCLDKDVDRRPQSIQEVAKALHAMDESRSWTPESGALYQEPVLAPPPPSAGPEKPAQIAPSGILARPGLRAVAVLAAIFVLASAGWTVWNAFFSGPELSTIAVLPFQYDGVDTDHDFLALGLTEDVITQLSKIQALDVIARTSMMEYRDTRKKIGQIAGELGAGSVVSGSIRHLGERIRITASLVGARGNQNLWTESYDRDLGDLLEVQIDVARQIAAALGTTLSAADVDRLRAGSAVDPEAYELYLKGRTTRDFSESQGGLHQARAYFESALVKDPTFALAYAGLAEIDFLLGCSRYMPVEEVRPIMTHSVLKAMTTGNELPETHVSRGLLAYYDWDWRTAEDSFQRAVELNPHHSNARREHGLLLARTGRFAAAVEELRELLRTDPLSGLLHLQLGRIHFYRGQHEAALDELERFSAARQDVGGLFAVWDLTGTMVAAGRSMADVEAAIGPDLGAPPRLASLAYAHAAGGRRDTAVELLDRYSRLEPSSLRLRTWAAAVRAALDEKGAALTLLEEAFEIGECTTLALKVDPRFESLRADPRFVALLRRMGHDS